MKPASLLLAVSLAANLALAALYMTRTNPSGGGAASISVPPAQSAVARAASNDALRSALASGDAAALQAAGVPSDLARQIAFARTIDKLVARTRAAQGQSTGQWWRNRSAPLSREQQAQSRREIADAFTAAYGDDPGWFTPLNQPGVDFLSPDKRAALRRVMQDYDEMMAKFSADGFQLPSDREKQKLLQQERDRDIAALLSPDELAEYQMRTSTTAAALKNRYGDAITSEDEFRKIYALQKAFEDQNPPLSGRVTPEQMQARAAAAVQLQNDIKSAVGDDAYAALRRAADGDLRTVDSLATRLNLPANTTDTIAALRDNYAAQSQRIGSDASVPFSDRRTQLQSLATQAKADLAKTLGTEGAEAYAQRSPWVAMMQSGIGFSTTPPPASAAMSLAAGSTAGVFPVPPAGGSAGAGVRQGFTFVSSDGNAGGGTANAPVMMFSSGQPREPITNQVISVVTSEHTATAAPATTTANAAGSATPVAAPPASAPKP